MLCHNYHVLLPSFVKSAKVYTTILSKVSSYRLKMLLAKPRDITQPVVSMTTTIHHKLIAALGYVFRNGTRMML